MKGRKGSEAMWEAIKGSRELHANCRSMFRSLKSVRDPDGSRKAQQLLFYYEKPVKRAMKDLRISMHPGLWYLSSRAKRRKAMSAFNYLFDVCSIGLGPELQKLLK